jgi:hypothetical protein
VKEVQGIGHKKGSGVAKQLQKAVTERQDRQTVRWTNKKATIKNSQIVARHRKKDRGKRDKRKLKGQEKQSGGGGGGKGVREKDEVTCPYCPTGTT